MNASEEHLATLSKLASLSPEDENLAQLEAEAAEVLRAIADRIDWWEFGIDAAFLAECSWKEFVTEAGEQGNVRDAYPRYVRYEPSRVEQRTRRASCATAKWLTEIITVSPDYRLELLLRRYSDPFIWGLPFQLLDEKQEQESKQSRWVRKAQEALDRQRAGEPLDDLQEGAIRAYYECENRIAIYQADIATLNRQRMAIEYGLGKRHLELLEKLDKRFPRLNINLERPSNAEFREFAERCGGIHARLVRELEAESAAVIADGNGKAKPAVETIEPDGPIPPNRFRCNGREFCLPHKTWRIASAAWTSENRSLTFVDAEDLHGDSITKNVAKRIQRNFNDKSAGSGISMSLAAECFTIEFRKK